MSQFSRFTCWNVVPRVFWSSLTKEKLGIRLTLKRNGPPKLTYNYILIVIHLASTFWADFYSTVELQRTTVDSRYLEPGLSRIIPPPSRTITHSPWFCLLFFSHLLLPISNSVISNPPLSRTKCDLSRDLISNCGKYDVEWPPGEDSHIKVTGMLVGNFKLQP